MSSKSLGHEWACDLCKLTFRGDSQPTDLILSFRVSTGKPGWAFSQTVDVCHRCFPQAGYFTDPESKKPLEKSFIEKLLSFTGVKP